MNVVLRIVECPGTRVPDYSAKYFQTLSHRHPGRGRRAVRGGGEQLPAQRRRQLPEKATTQVYDEGQEIRQLLIDWAQARGVIDPSDFFQPNWKLVREGTPVL
ncbi:hypothetical protein ACTMSW_12050 [Micromonospora sp. BQ11]|uniref:hypothetical protein n=1 Tax=Micromonospora sp. BQ11 TaxID=3452212 RepID=UPI003F892DE8